MWLDPVIVRLVPGEWQVSPAFTGSCFKINQIIPDLPTFYFSGQIAQANIDNGNLLIYNPQPFVPSEDNVIYNFVNPPPFAKTQLAFKANNHQLLGTGQSWNWSVSISEFSPAPTKPNFVSGMSLWLDGTGLTDQSGNHHDASPISNPPAIVTGIDSQSFLQWNGSGTQELQIPSFLAGTTAATLYIVFTVLADTNYNLVRAAGLDDYWHFQDESGYFGTFLSSRFNGYPSATPASGSHLISVHANNAGYEVLVDNTSKGLQAGNFYNPGDRFRINTRE